MKVLHINTERTWRGGEQQTLYLMQALTAQGVFCDLVCQSDSPLAQRAQKANLNVYPLRIHGEADLVACHRIRKLIKKFKYDILHCHTSHAHTLAFLASTGCKVGRLVTRRVDFSIYRHSFLGLSGLKYRRMADYYIAISRQIKNVLVADGVAAERIAIVHSGVDPRRFAGASGDHLIAEFDLRPGEKVVINVAHLAPHKGQQFLVRAVPRVVAEIPEVRFFIVGEGRLLADLKDLAVSLGIGRELVFTGFRGDVGDFYNIADLFVMSSVNEGLGTAVLDALAAGLTVVASDTGGLPEIIEDGKTGRLVKPGDAQALARGIIDLLKDPGQAGRMAVRGRALVEQQYTCEVMARKNLDIYRMLASRGGRCLRSG